MNTNILIAYFSHEGEAKLQDGLAIVLEKWLKRNYTI